VASASRPDPRRSTKEPNTLTHATAFGDPVVARHGADDPSAPLVVLLHGRGSNEHEILSLAPHLPDGVAYAATRPPVGSPIRRGPTS